MIGSPGCLSAVSAKAAIEPKACFGSSELCVQESILLYAKRVKVNRRRQFAEGSVHPRLSVLPRMRLSAGGPDRILRHLNCPRRSPLVKALEK